MTSQWRTFQTESWSCWKYSVSLLPLNWKGRGKGRHCWRTEPSLLSPVILFAFSPLFLVFLTSNWFPIRRKIDMAHWKKANNFFGFLNNFLSVEWVVPNCCLHSLSLLSFFLSFVRYLLYFSLFSLAFPLCKLDYQELVQPVNMNRFWKYPDHFALC